MGCDIHIFLEFKDKETNEYYYVPKYGIENYGFDDYYGSPHCRNYNLFATLANIRNYNNTQFISEPLGVPEDASPSFLEEVQSYGPDGHSHSYFHVNELLEHPLMKDHVDTSFYNWLVSLSEMKDFNTKDMRVCFFFDN